MTNYDLIILQYHLFILGGIETYYYRIMKWANDNKIKTILIIDKDGEFDSSWEKKLNDLDVSVYYASGMYPNYKFRTRENKEIELNETNKVFNISASYECFIRGEYIRTKFKTDTFNNVFYVFHPHTVKLSPYRLIDNSLKKKYLSQMIQYNSLVFMDEETRSSGVSYYPDIIHDEQIIIRLGYEVQKEVTVDSLIKKYNQPEKTIYAILRFEFPFKSYIFGVIDAFARLCPHYSGLKLVIIGKGPGLSSVKAAVNSLDEITRKKIQIVEGVPYDDLLSYIDESYIYIGMGTTLLDFANRSVPSVIGIAYEEKDISYGIWADHPTIVGGKTDEKLAPFVPISVCVEKILKMSEKEYLEVCHETRKQFVKYYSMNQIMPMLLGIENNKDVVFNNSSLSLCSINYIIKKKTRKIKMKIKEMFPFLVKIRNGVVGNASN